MDPVTATHIVSRETWPNVVKTIATLATLAFIAHDAREHTIYVWSVGVLALVVSPNLARVFNATRLAKLLKDDVPQ